MPKEKGAGGVQIPQDLSSLSDDELNALEESAVEEFDRLSEDENVDAGGLARMTELADGIDAVRGDRATRETQRAEAQRQREELRGRVHTDGTEDGPDTTVDAGDDEDSEDADADVEPALLASARRRRVDVRDVIKSGNRLNVRLSDAAARQPSTMRPVPLGQKFGQTVLVASADIPGYTAGGAISDMNGLVEAYKSRARALPASRALYAGRPMYDHYLDVMGGQASEKFGLVGHEGDWRQVPRFPVAQMQRQFRYSLDIASKPEDAWDVMQAASNPDALVAAGGWCSPSEVRYDFYNIVAMDGGLDLPTTGIARGGMRWPTSPSFGDLASSTGLWHWTETQDIAAVTGTAQSGTKTCARVPCAAFNEVRLEGEGVCITAGNLTTDAWPEQIANFLRLVNAAHFHRVNSWFISNIVANSTAVSLTTGVANASATSDILAGVEHQVWDMRTKYAMADTDVLEVIFPSWVLGLIRADISRRNGLDTPDSAYAVADAQIAAWFRQRYVSVQFVQDFDVRGANQFGQSSALNTAWPSTVRFIIYPAGTWLRGNGLNLDLGIIRDSTLNATNDYTAAWTEEFFTLAKIGHESRICTVANTLPTGGTGALVSVTGI